MEKSVFYNILKPLRKAEASNYIFCIIESNMGIIKIPDMGL
jgi:ribosome-binding ATPase YchF (GTP1/OBG family)